MMFSLREICFYRVQCSSIMKTALQFTLRDQSKLECSLDSFLKTTKMFGYFLKIPCLLQKPLVFGKIYILIILNMCFQLFAQNVWPRGGQKLGNARNFNKAKSGFSQIHLRQIFHFILDAIIVCNYYLKFVVSKISTNRPKQNVFVL